MGKPRRSGRTHGQIGAGARPSWQAGEWQWKVILRSLGARKLLSSEKTTLGVWVGFTTCVLGHPGWQSRSPKVVAQTPPPCIGPQEFTDADLKIWMSTGMGCISASGRSRRYVKCLSASPCLVYQGKNLKPDPLAWPDWSVAGLSITRDAFSSK